MLTAVIVDDEKNVINMIKSILQTQECINIVGEYTDSEKALEGIKEIKPDVAFLDIMMPKLNGIELATEFMGTLEDINIVFITAYDNYAIQAFKLNAIHYILKPPSNDDIHQVISRITADKKRPPVTSLVKIYIRMFGGMQINGKTSAQLKWPTAKTEELFALFLLSISSGIDKWKIIDKLWPDSIEGKREQLLYSTIYRLKKTLIEYGINANITNKLGIYKMDIDNLWLDINEFESLYKNYRETHTINDDTYERLIALYNGDLLGCRDYEWCELYRHELTRKHGELLFEIETYYKSIKDNIKVKEIQSKREMLDM